MVQAGSVVSDLLVTGDGGFVGGHVLRLVAGAFGLSAAWPTADVRDKAGLVAALKVRPFTHVLHLAARSFVPESFRQPRLTFDVNFLGTLNLLEALSETNFCGRMLFVSSGDVYGRVDAVDLPLRESHLPKPGNPYAVSKLAAEALCYQWSLRGEFEVLVARPFNHIGAGQSELFAVSGFAKQVAEIAAGQRSTTITVGNVAVTRDFADVRDVVAAYALLLAQGQNGAVYNVCSGVERSLRSVIDQLLKLAGVEADLVCDVARLRPSDQTRVFGDCSKLKGATGWQPAVSMEQSLLDLLAYWENEIG